MASVPEPAVKAWIREFGVAVPRGATAPSPEDVEAAARDLACPLVVKAFGSDLVHKSDAGAVRLNIGSPRAAAEAAAEMR
ncbi:MAG: acetate--CoA ligase family protein, partial [Actinomadura rubrobrunea]|nr:acetate--CoA ligase family protein [Actinomadura rubrobrunea]